MSAKHDQAKRAKNNAADVVAEAFIANQLIVKIVMGGFRIGALVDEDEVIAIEHPKLVIDRL